MTKSVFLSHIHEEKELALLLQEALEDEFSGFVKVFVSSDGESIPAGSNFLRRIEDRLVDGAAALYLISPKSVKRNWINFELGAVWIRSAISLRTGGPEIPTIPLCHSGIQPAELPAPLNNLNAIVACQSSQLENAFRSIQAAVGVAGRKLRTDFDALALKISAFESKNTVGDRLKEVVKLLNNANDLIRHVEKMSPHENVQIQMFAPSSAVERLRELERRELQGKIHITVRSSTVQATENGVINGADLLISLPVSLILQFRAHLLS